MIRFVPPRAEASGGGPPRVAPAGEDLPVTIIDRALSALVPVTLTMTEIFRRGLAFTTGAAVIYLAVLGLGEIEQTLIAIAVAALLAVGLNPMVEWLARRRLRRTAAVAVVIGGVALFLVGALALVLPALIAQASVMAAALPGWLEQLRTNQFLSDTVGRLGFSLHVDGSPELTEAVSNRLLAAGASVAGAVAQVLVVAVLTVYFLANLHLVKLLAHAPDGTRISRRVAAVAQPVIDRLGGYLGAIALVALQAAVVGWLLATALDLPSPLAVGVIAGLLDFVPVLGPLVAGSSITLLGFTQSTTVGIIAGAFYLGHHVFEAYWLHPRVLRRQIELSPLLTIVSVIVGGSLLGIAGALLAVPLAAAASVIRHQLQLTTPCPDHTVSEKGPRT